MKTIVTGICVALLLSEPVFAGPEDCPRGTSWNEALQGCVDEVRSPPPPTRRDVDS